MLTKTHALCPTCRPSTRRGLLWLMGGDWLECPSCFGKGEIEIVEQIVTPLERTISVGGRTMRVPKHHPLHEKVS